jgi:hypothetical protein
VADPGPPATLEVLSGGDQPDAVVGAALPQPLEVRVRNAFGATLADVRVVWSLAAGEGTVTPTESLTDAEGVARAEWTLGTAAGEQQASAAVEGLEPVVFTVQARPGPTSVVSLPDTVRFTALQQIREVLSFTDQFGNPTADPGVLLRTSNALIAEVTTGNRLRSRGVGTTTAVVHWNGLADTAVVHVEQVLAHLSIYGPLDGTLDVGREFRYSVSATDSSGVGVHDPVLTWSTSDGEIAAVEQDGTVTGLGGGAVSVIARAGEVSGSRLLRVYFVHEPGTLVTLTDHYFASGDLSELAALGVAPDGSLRVKWVLPRNLNRNDGLAALTATGQRIWERDRLGQGPLAIGSDGTSYLTDARYLHAIAPDGSDRWLFQLCTDTSSCDAQGATVAVDAAGRLYVPAGQGGTLFVVHPDGSLAWSAAMGAARGTVALAPDGTVYLLTPGAVVAFSAEGARRWELLGAFQPAHAAVDAEGVIYFESEGGLTAMTPQGQQRWRSPGTPGLPVVGPDGSILVSRAAERTLTSLSRASGGIRWQLEPGWVEGLPFVAANGLVYLRECHRTPYLYTVAASSGEVVGRTRAPCGSFTFAGPNAALADGRLYLVDRKSVYAYEVGMGSGSEWSQPGGGASRTWRAAAP